MQQRMSYKDFRKRKQPQSRSKYGNKKVEQDGHVFDSIAEMKYYNQLKWLKQAKQIKNFKLQPKFVLQEGFKKNGKTFRPIHYVADFEVINLDGTKEIIDIKGVRTKDFRLKQKLFEMKYSESITLLKYEEGKGFVEVG